MKILMVCLGNICRSPMAEGILHNKAVEKGLNIEVDSAGFVPFHTGDHADERAIQTAHKHGVDISNVFSRLFKYEDFAYFDKIYVMDLQNYNDVIKCAKTNADKEKVELILNTLFPGKNQVVPDPYYGNGDGFEKVFALLDSACEVICQNIENRRKH